MSLPPVRTMSLPQGRKGRRILRKELLPQGRKGRRILRKESLPQGRKSRGSRRVFPADCPEALC
jgi:hypothetical protein